MDRTRRLRPLTTAMTSTTGTEGTTTVSTTHNTTTTADRARNAYDNAFRLEFTIRSERRQHVASHGCRRGDCAEHAEIAARLDEAKRKSLAAGDRLVAALAAEYKASKS